MSNGWSWRIVWCCLCRCVDFRLCCWLLFSCKVNFSLLFQHVTLYSSVERFCRPFHLSFVAIWVCWKFVLLISQMSVTADAEQMFAPRDGWYAFLWNCFRVRFIGLWQWLRAGLHCTHCAPGQPAPLPCRAIPPPRYHSPSLASVNGRCMASPCGTSNTTTLASSNFCK